MTESDSFRSAKCPLTLAQVAAPGEGESSTDGIAASGAGAVVGPAARATALPLR
jgi:hypothetical protein